MWPRLPRAKLSTPCLWQGACMGGTRALHKSFGIHMAFVKNFNAGVHQLLLWDSFLLPQWCKGRPPFTQKPLWAASPNCYNGSACRQEKRSSAFMLLCNLSFIPQRPSPADKNKTLHANGYFCHHPQRWHLCLLLAQDAWATESTSSSQEVQELPWPVKLVTCFGGHADGEERFWVSNFFFFLVMARSNWRAVIITGFANITTFFWTYGKLHFFLFNFFGFWFLLFDFPFFFSFPFFFCFSFSFCSFLFCFSYSFCYFFSFPFFFFFFLYPFSLFFFLFFSFFFEGKLIVFFLLLSHKGPVAQNSILFFFFLSGSWPQIFCFTDSRALFIYSALTLLV